MFEQLKFSCPMIQLNDGFLSLGAEVEAGCPTSDCLDS